MSPTNAPNIEESNGESMQDLIHFSYQVNMWKRGIQWKNTSSNATNAIRSQQAKLFNHTYVRAASVEWYYTYT